MRNYCELLKINLRFCFKSEPQYSRNPISSANSFKNFKLLTDYSAYHLLVVDVMW